jgi:hypothetical protein
MTTKLQQIATAAKEAQAALEQALRDAGYAWSLERRHAENNINLAQSALARILALAEEVVVTTVFKVGDTVICHSSQHPGTKGEIIEIDDPIRDAIPYYVRFGNGDFRDREYCSADELTLLPGASEPERAADKKIALHQHVLWRGYPGEITKVFVDTRPNYKVELDNGRTIEVDGWELGPMAAGAPDDLDDHNVMTVDEIAGDPRI